MNSGINATFLLLSVNGYVHVNWLQVIRKWDNTKDRRYCFYPWERVVEGKSDLIRPLHLLLRHELFVNSCAFIPLQHCWILQYWDYFRNNATSPLQFGALNNLFSRMNVEITYQESRTYHCKAYTPTEEVFYFFCNCTIPSYLIICRRLGRSQQLEKENMQLSWFDIYRGVKFDECYLVYEK